MPLGPRTAQTLDVPNAAKEAVEITIAQQKGGEVLASFTTPLPIPKVSPPSPEKFKEKPDDQLTVEELYLKGDKFDRSTNRLKAREYFDKALAKDSGFVPALRRLAVLDFEAALYDAAIPRLEKALDRDPADGTSWFYLGACHLRKNNPKEAMRCGYEAAKLFGTESVGHDLAGRAAMRMKNYGEALTLFSRAMPKSLPWGRLGNHVLLALYASGRRDFAFKAAENEVRQEPTDRVARALLALRDPTSAKQFAEQGRNSLGEYEFEMLETSLVFAEVGLAKEAAAILQAAFLDGVAEGDQAPLALYYLAYFASLQGEAPAAQTYLQRAARINKDFVFPSRPEEVEILTFAVEKNPADANAQLHLGNLLANLGRLDEAAARWQKAADSAAPKAMPLRNLALLAWARDDLPQAEALYRKAIAARPGDQTLFRDLGEILVAAGKRPEAIHVLEGMPVHGMRRAEITIALAQAYVDEKQYDHAVKLLESTPYFVNWEGQDVTWRIFNKAHVERGRERMERQGLRRGAGRF